MVFIVFVRRTESTDDLLKSANKKLVPGTAKQARQSLNVKCSSLFSLLKALSTNHTAARTFQDILSGNSL